MHETQSGTKTTTTWKSMIGPIAVKPDESIYMFEKQLQFPGGLEPMGTKEFLTHNTCTPPPIDSAVTMTVPITRIYLLKGINVRYFGGHVYSKDFIQVHGREAERHNNLADINKGYGGKF